MTCDTCSRAGPGDEAGEMSVGAPNKTRNQDHGTKTTEPRPDDQTRLKLTYSSHLLQSVRGQAGTQKGVPRRRRKSTIQHCPGYLPVRLRVPAWNVRRSIEEPLARSLGLIFDEANSVLAAGETLQAKALKNRGGAVPVRIGNRLPRPQQRITRWLVDTEPQVRFSREKRPLAVRKEGLKQNIFTRC